MSVMSGGGVWGLIFRFLGVLSKNVGEPCVLCGFLSVGYGGVCAVGGGGFFASGVSDAMGVLVWCQHPFLFARVTGEVSS